MGTKKTTLAANTAKDRIQDPDDNIQMHHWCGIKVLTGPHQHKKQHMGQYAL